MTIEICGIITTGADPETPGKGGGGGGAQNRGAQNRKAAYYIIGWKKHF